jgi:hypothetical protein
MLKALRPVLLFPLFLQFASAQSSFTKPSEAYAFAQQPITDWQAAIHAHTAPRTVIEPDDEARKRAAQLCPSFSVDNESGEELYWLAKLCESNREKAFAAIQRYLAGSDLQHGPDARLTLAALQLRMGGNWEPAWPTLKLILQQDPMDEVQSQIDVAIDDETDTNAARALDWSKERYAILLARNRTPNPGAEPLPLSYALYAGASLVHYEYLAGDVAAAEKLRDEINTLEKSSTEQIGRWAEDEVFWANMELKPAPPVPALSVFGKRPAATLAEPGRVQVISFFFVGCAPCESEVSDLDALQKRYGTQKLLVADVTTRKANEPSARAPGFDLDRSLSEIAAKQARHIAVVITSDDALASYSVRSFPVVAILDKRGKIRYIGNALDFEDDDAAGKLIRQLVNE